MLKNEEMRKNICLGFQYFMPGWNNKEFPFFIRKPFIFSIVKYLEALQKYWRIK